MSEFLRWLSIVWVVFAAITIVGLLAYVAWTVPAKRFDILWFAFSVPTGAAVSFLLSPKKSY